MHRLLGFALLLVGANTALAGDKVYTLTAGNLKIDGSVVEDDAKVKITNPENNRSGALPAKVYELKLAAGKYQFNADSTEIDPVLAIQDKSGKQVAFDDDGGGGLNSKVVFEAKEGNYKVVVASLDKFGQVALTVKQIGGGGAPAVAGAKSFEGSVEADDPTIIVEFGGKELEKPAKMHSFKMEAGKKYQIDVMAKDKIDPYLVIQDSAGKVIATDDDGGDGLNSRLVFQAPKNDTYKLFAAALQGKGKYLLTVKQLDGGDKVPVDKKGGDGPAVGPKTFEGTVGPDDEKVAIMAGGKTVDLPAKLHSMKLDAGKKYQIDVVVKDKDSIDPVLVVQTADGKQIAFDDDGGGFPNSRLVLQVPKSDTYKLYVANLGEQGKYAMTVKELGGAAKPPVGKTLEVGAAGLKVNGALSAENKQVVYPVKLEEGKTYVIDLKAAENGKLDPYVEVRGPNGQKLAEDDDGGEGLNSRLTFKAPSSGTFQIVARSFLGVGAGEYVLEVRAKDE